MGSQPSKLEAGLVPQQELFPEAARTAACAYLSLTISLMFSFSIEPPTCFAISLKAVLHRWRNLLHHNSSPSNSSSDDSRSESWGSRRSTVRFCWVRLVPLLPKCSDERKELAQAV